MLARARYSSVDVLRRRACSLLLKQFVAMADDDEYSAVFLDHIRTPHERHTSQVITHMGKQRDSDGIVCSIVGRTIVRACSSFSIIIYCTIYYIMRVESCGNQQQNVTNKFDKKLM